MNNSIVLRESDIDKAILSGVNVTKSLVQHLENVLIEKALIKTKGNQRAAAELIGMSRTKLGQRARVLAKTRKPCEV
ncbi:helix-turn-helix domain-containing protein [Acinetobacter corruptisaponis]|uniref:Helix-turn-helix domain-containing protein n=1 Tax=Acinetobacter corruptisaponis TaxID=3045147 RepID=A0ABY8S8Q9_9GAMM|nr:helix-turn-helix domain-containing protein [Acinetobacter sp. KCTC 92772]WHP06877.1 helix-turn-helix domain-containing protein [Acinetobacter sp. KCTC 92772]